MQLQMLSMAINQPSCFMTMRQHGPNADAKRIETSGRGEAD